MSTMFEDVPAVREGDIEVEPCTLVVELLGEASDPSGAWAMLPAKGEGVVMLTDAIRRYDPADRAGRLLCAEVADGPVTWVVRLTSRGYEGWQWTESPGSTHRVCRRAYLSSEPVEGEPDRHLYAHYWKLVDDDGVSVYKPCGARFSGFDHRKDR